MLIKSEAIVLTALRYSESDLIVTLFTELSGVKSYLLRGVLKTKKGKLRPSLFQPLTFLSIEAIHKNKGTLERLKEAKILTPYEQLHTQIIKNSLVFFIAELLKNAIKEEESNPELYEFLKTSLYWLDRADQFSNFHIAFLIRLTQFLGFYPDDSDSEGKYFDLNEGIFTNQERGPQILDEKTTQILKQFLGTTFEASMRIKLSKEIRNHVLNMLLVYFELHLHGFKRPRSLAVLQEIFN